MRFYRATEADSDELKNFYSEVTLHGPIDISNVRPRNFFDQYRLQSSDFETFVLKNNENQIEGLGTIIYRKANIKGEEVLVGYCTDLRIAPTREAILTWTKHFLPVLEMAMKTRGCKYFFSVVVPQDGKAYNALVRPRSSRRNIPRFYMLSRFELVNVLGRLPLASKPLRTIEIDRGDIKDLEPLVQYLSTKSKERNLSFIYTMELMKERFSRWPGFQIENFLIARDHDKNIIGCVAPWDSFEVQHFRVAQYHGFSRTLKRALDLSAFFGLSQSLPALDHSLNFLYLTHLYADNPDIFYSLLYESYEMAKPTKFLTYQHFSNDLTTLPPKAFISTTFPLAVYSLLPPAVPLPEFLRMSLQQFSPDIEAALI